MIAPAPIQVRRYSDLERALIFQETRLRQQLAVATTRSACVPTKATRQAVTHQLAEADVREIYARRAASRIRGAAQVFAERYGVSRQTVKNIWRGTAWRHLWRESAT